MKLRSALVTILLLVASVDAPAGSASLRAGFVAAFGEHFELVKEEVKTRPNESGGGTFWLAYVKPRTAGYFALQYRFKPKGQHYSHVEHEISFGVGPKGCRRGPPPSGVYGRFCLGDTVIVPVVFEPGTGYEFKFVKVLPATDEDAKMFDELYSDSRDRDLDKAPVANPSESLRYVGRSSHKALHRSPGYTIRLAAHFEAVKPGKFNLLVSSSPSVTGDGKNSAGSIPIIVVDRETPVTLIAGREEVRGFSMGHNGQEYVSSTTGNSYMSSLMVLQPGDRISVLYLSARRGPQFEREGYARRDGVDPAEATMPVISVHPFSIETKYDYSDWLVDYLP